MEEDPLWLPLKEAPRRSMLHKINIQTNKQIMQQY